MSLDILDCIWGSPSAQDPKINNADMEWFLVYCKAQINSSGLFDYPPARDSPLRDFIVLLKNNPSSSRQDLKDRCNSTTSGWVSSPKPQDIDTWLSLTARILLCINCRRDEAIQSDLTITDESTQAWSATQSIQNVIEAAFPCHTLPPDDATSQFRSRKLDAQSIEHHEDIAIVWTTNLAKHLFLDVRDATKKKLFVFELACFAETSYNACKAQPLDLGIEESLKLGCYPPSLLHELKRTYQLLFPPGDEDYLTKKVRADGKDKRLYEEFVVHREISSNPASLTTRRELFEQYPRWAPRLLRLYEEIEDPTPTTWLERYSDRRKSARHVYTLTYLALVLALLLGILTVTLGILQVWISYCDWKGDIGGICGSQPADGIHTAPGTNLTVATSSKVRTVVRFEA